ncbi:FAD-dependent monooxygenase [Stappia sp. F7233]|uniref:FAD-dependent monooxygenase n=1 Tax=Stappia albiluteola TaxID=2758565 RepID=A0A839AFR7_9HYPH|nr:FAD-dependent monooxygenase [Stappia albiluteola]MBA5777627.1 FAD-dependent monooxygenase [Stappia albiluteola]
MSDVPLVIAGAGIGGLAAALHLGAGGRKIIIIEKAERLEAVGAGLQISPNALKVLQKLGLGSSIRAAAFRPEAISIRSMRNGREIAQVPLGMTIKRRHGAPYLVLHRADLQTTLLEATRQHDNIEVRLATRLVDAEQDADGVSLRLETSHGSDHLRADALIGADGVWSTVRRRILGLRQAVFSGRTAYRAVVDIEGVAETWRSTTGLWLGADAHVVHYPISAGKKLNIVVLVKERWEEETWSTPAGSETLLARFPNAPADLKALLQQPQGWLKWALCGMDPGSTWVDGRIGLLGDAAHAMLPFVAQGAAMAIEDAAILGQCFDRNENAAQALVAYEAARRERADRVLRVARDNDGIYHMGFPLSLARDAVLSRISPERLLSRYDWLYGWEAD